MSRAFPVASWWTAIRQGTPRPSANWRRTRWPGPLGATMPTSTPGGGSIWPKWIEKPWANSSRLPGRDPVADLVLPDLGLLLVGQQDHHDVAAARRLARRRAPRAPRPRPRRGSPSPGEGRPRPRSPSPSGSARARGPASRSRGSRSSCPRAREVGVVVVEDVFRSFIALTLCVGPLDEPLGELAAAARRRRSASRSSCRRPSPPGRRALASRCSSPWPRPCRRRPRPARSEAS